MASNPPSLTIVQGLTKLLGSYIFVNSMKWKTLKIPLLGFACHTKKCQWKKKTKTSTKLVMLVARISQFKSLVSTDLVCHCYRKQCWAAMHDQHDSSGDCHLVLRIVTFSRILPETDHCFLWTLYSWKEIQFAKDNFHSKMISNIQTWSFYFISNESEY